MLRSNRNSADSSSASMRASFFSPDACSRDFLIVWVPRIQTANALLVQNSLTVEESFEILAELQAKFDLNSQMSQPMRRETLRLVFRNAGMTLYVTAQHSTFYAMLMIDIQGPGVTAIPDSCLDSRVESNVILISEQSVSVSVVLWSSRSTGLQNLNFFLTGGACEDCRTAMWFRTANLLHPFLGSPKTKSKGKHVHGCHRPHSTGTNPWKIHRTTAKKKTFGVTSHKKTCCHSSFQR